MEKGKRARGHIRGLKVSSKEENEEVVAKGSGVDGQGEVTSELRECAGQVADELACLRDSLDNTFLSAKRLIKETEPAFSPERIPSEEKGLSEEVPGFSELSLAIKAIRGGIEQLDALLIEAGDRVTL